jgi:flavorubredoxin/flavin reductase (DIM6/NTAB) family NADH-FMN oxidoreductase RutF|mmetsp:Transcript_183/g.723  ORF Transcript_183/g.723 Transcript_183/m.723 type:complete len:625 (+) Transcript_183:72-1946(+)
MAASCLSARGLASAAPALAPTHRGARARRAVDTTTRAKAVAEPPASEVRNSDITMWEGTKRLQTQTTEIGPDTTCIRSLDWDRDRFDIEFGLEKGTTYNSYVIKGSEKTALVDASHEKFKQLYLDTLAGVVDLKDIDYIVCSHTEPDHSGLIGPILDLAPNATVVGSKVCLKFLEDLVQKPFKQQVVKGGDVVDLGGGHALKFIMAPNLHWPDTMFSFDPASKLMYTCDAFGSHLCSEDVFDTSLEQVLPHYRFYYECLMKPNARSVLTALRKCASEEADFVGICNGHGPLLKYNVEELVGGYKRWSEDALEKAKAKTAVFYTSDYGFSDRLSQSVARGLCKAEVEVEMMDMNTADTQELIEAVAGAAGIVLLAPPTSGPAHDALAAIVGSCNKKQKLLIGESYGGADEPVDTLAVKFAGLGLAEVVPALRVKEAPTEATYQLFEESGTDLGQVLTKKEALKAMKSAMSPDVARALGRVSGGLYVVTAAQGTATSAMVASWVAQASFEPLGFTVAIAKDRAIESLMQVGDKFVLNCLPEEGFEPIMKHFLIRFPPGADRFEGVEWAPASCGAPILKEAAAYMECTVVSRMEAADHWIVYSEVRDGKVFKDEKTATHHRKVASYY